MVMVTGETSGVTAEVIGYSQVAEDAAEPLLYVKYISTGTSGSAGFGDANSSVFSTFLIFRWPMVGRHMPLCTTRPTICWSRSPDRFRLQRELRNLFCSKRCRLSLSKRLTATVGFGV